MSRKKNMNFSVIILICAACPGAEKHDIKVALC